MGACRAPVAKQSDIEKARALNCPVSYTGTGCQQKSAKFIVLDGDADLLALEQGVVANLAAVGIDVTTELLERDAFNAAMTSGDFNL